MAAALSGLSLRDLAPLSVSAGSSTRDFTEILNGAGSLWPLRELLR